MSPRQPASSTRPIRVRTRRDYTVRYTVDLGQRNATFIERPFSPLRRVFRWADAFALLPEPDYDLVHALNAVPLTRRPSVISFEDYLPRVPEDRYVGWLERALQRRLLDDRYFALLALSRYAMRQFRRQNREFAGLPQLEAKLKLRYPAIALRREEPKPSLGATLRLLFVGRDFMQKGAPALLRAHELLQRGGVPVQTTVVSSLRWREANAYAHPPDPELAERTKAQLAQDGITHHFETPHAEVMRLMEEADFLAFPTLHDTFGYVALEALACGTPVLASATNALPEVVEDGRNGFLLPLELDGELGRWAWTYRTDEPGFVGAYEETMRGLGDAMAARLAELWESRERYPALSAGALEMVRERFDLASARAELEVLYESARGPRPASTSS
ncbi:MAG TPA: glycosyltransferase family 4 protein [Solirubrobacteraceae bacterium]|nr:glycosyltransferase family 4 protein [Solirubrobacteraceae bacterium]